MGSYSTSEENVNEACSSTAPTSGWASPNVILSTGHSAVRVRQTGVNVAQTGQNTAYGRLIGKKCLMPRAYETFVHVHDLV